MGVQTLFLELSLRLKLMQRSRLASTRGNLWDLSHGQRKGPGLGLVERIKKGLRVGLVEVFDRVT